MQCNAQEFAAPSPTNTTTFSMQLPSGVGFTIGIRANNVYFDCYWQGTVHPLITRNFVYIPVGSSVVSWDDVTDRQNFMEFVEISQGTYALVEKY
jgi:hypothetical protein